MAQKANALLLRSNSIFINNAVLNADSRYFIRCFYNFWDTFLLLNAVYARYFIIYNKLCTWKASKRFVILGNLKFSWNIYFIENFTLTNVVVPNIFNKVFIEYLNTMARLRFTRNRLFLNSTYSSFFYLNNYSIFFYSSSSNTRMLLICRKIKQIYNKKLFFFNTFVNFSAQYFVKYVALQVSLPVHLKALKFLNFSRTKIVLKKGIRWLLKHIWTIHASNSLLGVKVNCNGRWTKTNSDKKQHLTVTYGVITRQRFFSFVDFAATSCTTFYGKFGIRAWICFCCLKTFNFY